MARRLVDHASILEWANTRGASPARVATPLQNESDPGLRLQFTGNGHSSETAPGQLKKATATP